MDRGSIRYRLLQLSNWALLFAATETLGGYIAGCYLGRLACYGTLGVRLFHEGFPLRVIAGHLDGAGGLRPVD
jgi:hypothetical protein